MVGCLRQLFLRPQRGSKNGQRNLRQIHQGSTGRRTAVRTDEEDPKRRHADAGASRSLVRRLLRGGSILHISEQANGYAAKFDANYFEEEVVALPPPTIQAAGDCSNWVAVLPKLKETMNTHFATRRKSEREFQQLCPRRTTGPSYPTTPNTSSRISSFPTSDQGAKLDMVGLKWLSGQRKDDHPLVSVE